MGQKKEAAAVAASAGQRDSEPSTPPAGCINVDIAAAEIHKQYKQRLDTRPPHAGEASIAEWEDQNPAKRHKAGTVWHSQ